MRPQPLTVLDKRNVRVTFFLLTLILAVIYFIQITSVAARGSQLKKLTKEESSLSIETHRIEGSIAENSSAAQLQKQVNRLGLVTPAHIEYARVDGNSVAFK